jgi:hypothetical protein
VPTPVAVVLILTLGRYADVAAATANVPAKSACNCHHFFHVFRGSRDCLCLCGIEGVDFAGGITCEAGKPVCEKLPQSSAGRVDSISVELVEQVSQPTTVDAVSAPALRKGVTLKMIGLAASCAMSFVLLIVFTPPAHVDPAKLCPMRPLTPDSTAAPNPGACEPASVVPRHPEDAPQPGNQLPPPASAPPPTNGPH